MKFIGDVPQFYIQKCDVNGVLWTQKRTNGHQCNSCHEFLFSSSVKPLQNILLKCSALFHKMVEIQYKPTLVEYDQSTICSFIKSPCSFFLAQEWNYCIIENIILIFISSWMEGWQKISYALLDIILFKFLVPMHSLILLLIYKPITLHWKKSYPCVFSEESLQRYQETVLQNCQCLRITLLKSTVV